MVLARLGIVDGVQGIGLPSWKVVANAVQLGKIPIWVGSPCAMARQLGESDPDADAVMKHMPEYVKAVAESDRNLSFN